MTSRAFSIRQHLRDANQSYLQHCGFAWRFGAKCLGASLAAFVHGIAPFLFTHTAGNTVRKLHRALEQRHER